MGFFLIVNGIVLFVATLCQMYRIGKNDNKNIADTPYLSAFFFTTGALVIDIGMLAYYYAHIWQLLQQGK